MKLIYSCVLFLFTCNVNAKGVNYVGCTPANNTVRNFLGISLTDSVDFIRWSIKAENGKYNLKCNYGIGKPNTPGFWNGGKWIELNGRITKTASYFSFENGTKILKALELNPSLIHFVDENKNLLIGTGGWAYTLSDKELPASDHLSVMAKQTVLKDSISYHGRTPCGDFSIQQGSPNCQRLKWSVVFYADPKTHEPTTYLLNRSNAMPKEYPGKTGKWKIITGKDGRIIYELFPNNNNTPTYLLKLDDNILVFTNKKGNLLVGNEDFSFTLSRDIKFN
jgi:hypothetical protein